MLDKRDRLKKFISLEFQKMRIESNLSQERMAEFLMMSPRSYVDLEHGKYLCSTVVFIVFIIQFEINKEEFFDKLKSVLESDENSDAA